MLNISRLLLVGLLSLTCYATVAAPILSFNNSGADISQTHMLGDSINLELWISGLQDEDLGAFDIDLTFDGSITQFDLFTWPLELTDFALFNSTAGSSSLFLEWVSLEFDLSAQADAFMLGNLSFTASGVGTSLIEIDGFLLSDAFGLALSADSFWAQITVQSDPSPVPVPEPGSLAMFALGLIGLLFGTKRWI